MSETNKPHNLNDAGEKPQPRSVAMTSETSPRRLPRPGTVSRAKIPNGTEMPVSSNTTSSEDFLLPSDSIWTVADDSLSPLPFYYPLQKTHALIRGVLPSVIASRISECLRALSIAATYDTEKATAKAETVDHARFVIRLYSAQDNDRNEKSGVIVECQRSFGSTISFHKSYHAIIAASKGLDNNETSAPKYLLARSLPNLSQTNDSTRQKRLSLQDTSCRKKSADVAPEPRPRIKDAVEIAHSLLKKDRVDANLLGMESLRILTDSSKTDHASACFVAKIVLNVDGEHDDFQDKLIALVKHWRLNGDDLHEEEDSFDRRHFGIMHNHALAVFANTLNVLADEGELDNVVRCQSWIRDELVSVLMEEVKQSGNKPHDAYLSAKCLNALMSVSAEVKSLAVKLDAMAVMQRSHVIGQCGHELLETESEQAMLILKDTL